VMPILDDTPLAEKVRYANNVLRTRPRDLEDTLAQLVHDEDPVIAASAIHFGAQRQYESLKGDYDYIATHRSPRDAFVCEAALWAARGNGASNDGLPVVALVDRIRTTPVFVGLSIDELFRVAEVGLEIRHQAGREISRAGQPPDEVFFLLDGALEVRGDDGPEKELSAPAVANVEEVLQGIPLKNTIRAIEHTIGFRVPAAVFLTMVSDNILMAQGLFRLLLGESSYRLHQGVTSQQISTPGGHSFRRDPLLAAATAAQLLALRASSSEVPLTAGSVVFEADSPPAAYQVLEGEVRLESPDRPSVVATKGTTFGVADTLAGTPSGWRAVAAANGRALRLDRDDLFGVMADHVDLMQSLFAEALRLRDLSPPQTVGHPESQFFA